MVNMKLLNGICLSVFMFVGVSCTDGINKSALTESGLYTADFDSVINGKKTELFVLKNSNGMEVCVTNFGGRIVSVMVPDRNGELKDVVLGYDNVAQYADAEHSPSDFGAAIGRYANRIGQGRIVVAGKTIQLPRNNFGHCLHGGPTGWQYQVYDAEQPNDSTLLLTMHSPDGDNNFPGNVTAKVKYVLHSENSIEIMYEAETDKETVINMTNHSYFNLNGDGSKDAADMVLYINADRYTPADSTYMTSGEILPVEGTPMDFRVPVPIGERVSETGFEQIRNANGLDHNWVLNTYPLDKGIHDKTTKGDCTQVAASLYSPQTGILLEVYTDEPGIQVYSGNFLGAQVKGKHGVIYPQRASCCLETQHFPDTPNKPQWPSAVLKPGEKYTSSCIYKFLVK